MGDASTQSTRMRDGCWQVHVPSPSAPAEQEVLQTHSCGAAGRGRIGGSVLVFQLGVYATPQLYTVLDTTPTHAVILLAHFRIKYENFHLLL